MGTRKNGAREGYTSDAASNTDKDLVGARGVATLMLLRIRVREKCRISLT